MIPHWKVVQNVAARYGAHEDSFMESAGRLARFKRGEIPLSSMEDDKQRVQLRVAREGGPPSLALERINGSNNLQDKNVLDKLSQQAQAVCRILQRGSALGTGFLIAGNIIITNHHVIEQAEDTEDMLAEFGYELDLQDHQQKTTSFKFNAAEFFLTSSLEKEKEVPNSGLDFTAVALERISSNGKSINDYNPIFLDGNKGKIIKGESCVLIQHPNGMPKKIVLKDTAFFSETGSRIVYESDTMPGSSGAVVIALGTCEVVALHHAGLSKTDGLNRPLTKTGELATSSTPDNEIDWIGNEGIKITMIIKAIKEAQLTPEMEKGRRAILSKTAIVEQQLSEQVAPSPDISPKTEHMPDVNTTSTGALQYFEVLLTESRAMRSHWELNADKLVPGLVSRKPLIPLSTNEIADRMEYITVRSAAHPWELAQQIENLPAIEMCTPDLESRTDIGVQEQASLTPRAEESAVYNDATAKPNEEEFMKKWETATWFKKATGIGPKEIRWWNWLAVNCPKGPDEKISPWLEVAANLSKLRYVQLDTGYTLHSKSYTAYDFEKDYDFLEDDDNAEDRAKGIFDRMLLKNPSHGTRTASITLGGKLASDPLELDGNGGLLNLFSRNLARLIPYRVTKSVIVIGRAKELVSAANLAIRNKTDVMFTCLGSYPRPMLEVIAQDAYANGVIWVCAAGNEVEVVVAPAMYPGTIAVGGSNPADDPWNGSSYGKTVDITAPGEDIYVPFVDKQGAEIMVYGSGTSYATPQVASAAMMWKARHYDQLKSYPGWEVAEAFRTCLKGSARKPAAWPERYYNNYGSGILDIEALLKFPLPASGSMKNAYEGLPPITKKDLGIKEAVHSIWNALKRKLSPGQQYESTGGIPLSPRGRAALEAFSVPGLTGFTESTRVAGEIQTESLIREFFDQ